MQGRHRGHHLHPQLDLALARAPAGGMVERGVRISRREIHARYTGDTGEMWGRYWGKSHHVAEQPRRHALVQEALEPDEVDGRAVLGEEGLHRHQG